MAGTVSTVDDSMASSSPGSTSQQEFGGLQCSPPAELGSLDVGGIGEELDAGADSALGTRFVISAVIGNTGSAACRSFTKLASLPLVCVEAALSSEVEVAGSGVGLFDGDTEPAPTVPIVAAFDIEPPLCDTINAASKYTATAELLAEDVLSGLPPSMLEVLPNLRCNYRRDQALVMVGGSRADCIELLLQLVAAANSTTTTTTTATSTTTTTRTRTAPPCLSPAYTDSDKDCICLWPHICEGAGCNIGKQLEGHFLKYWQPDDCLDCRCVEVTTASTLTSVTTSTSSLSTTSTITTTVTSATGTETTQTSETWTTGTSSTITSSRTSSTLTTVTTATFITATATTSTTSTATSITTTFTTVTETTLHPCSVLDSSGDKPKRVHPCCLSSTDLQPLGVPCTPYNFKSLEGEYCRSMGVCDGVRTGCFSPVGSSCWPSGANDDEGTCDFKGHCIVPNTVGSGFTRYPGGDDQSERMDWSIHLHLSDWIAVSIGTSFVVAVSVMLGFRRYRRRSYILLQRDAYEPMHLERLIQPVGSAATQTPKNGKRKTYKDPYAESML